MSNLATNYNEHKHNSIKQLHSSRVTKLINAKRIEDAELFFKLLHGNSYKDDETKFIVLANAYTVTSKKKLGWEQWGFKQTEINYNFLSSFLTLENCYMTVNSFISPLRQNDKCFQITSFYVDLDYYKIPKYANKTTNEMVEIMRKKGLFRNLEPSFFVDSGNGMYIYYLLENTLNGQLKTMQKLWKSLEEKIIERFKDFEADAKASDIARVVRVPGSVNQKTGRVAKLIYNTEKSFNYKPLEEVKRYTLKELADVLLDKKNKSSQKAKTDRATYKGATVLNWNINVAYKRCRDLEKLVELRKDCEGARDFICLLYRQSLLHQNFSEDESLKETINLAYKMQDFGYKDFDEKYIERATKPTIRYYKNFVQAQKDYKESDKSVTFNTFVKDKKCMLWTNAKMIKELGITQEEMKHMLTLFNQKEKNRRARENYNPAERKEKYKKTLEKAGKTLKSDSMEDCIKKMKDLLGQGLSSKEIMKILNLKKSTFYNYKKQIEN